MKRFITLLALTLALTGLTAAQSNIQVSGLNLPENVHAGSTYTDTVQVLYEGDTSIAVEIDLDITAEDTDTEGINFTADPQRTIVDPGKEKDVDIKLQTSTDLVPDNFTYSVKASSEIEKVSTDDGSTDTSSSGGSVIIDDGPEYNTSRLEMLGGFVEDGEFNQTELERLDTLIDDASEVMNDLREKNNELKQEKRNDTIRISELKQENAELRRELNETGDRTTDPDRLPTPSTVGEGLLVALRIVSTPFLPFLL